MRIRYMGNKHALAGGLAKLVAEQPAGVPVVDLFCGMCSVGAAIAPSGRQVWANDVQAYASLAARCHIASREEPTRSSGLAPRLMAPYSRNARALKKRFGRELEEERQALRGVGVRRYQSAYATWRHVGNDARRSAEARQLARAPDAFPARLCAITFAWGYFGLQQAIELDSIRFALDESLREGALTNQQHEWGLLSMLQAASVCASTPGHFAQYLGGASERSLARVLKQRRRSPWDEFLVASDELRPFGDASWRRKNRCYTGDALEVWNQLDTEPAHGAIIYADPPYSRDQYSRYYHVLETLVRYDYPQATGAGRYRPGRHQTAFSLKTKVAGAFEQLFEAIAERGFTLILSYPSNGLYMKTEPSRSLHELLTEQFSKVRLALRRSQTHSTLGSRHGKNAIAAQELVWVAR